MYIHWLSWYFGIIFASVLNKSVFTRRVRIFLLLSPSRKPDILYNRNYVTEVNERWVAAKLRETCIQTPTFVMLPGIPRSPQQLSIHPCVDAQGRDKLGDRAEDEGNIGVKYGSHSNTVAGKLYL